MSRAISPKDIGKYKAKSFPYFVFEAFNECIAENYTNGKAIVKQDDVINRILGKQDIPDHEVPGYYRREIFDKGWLNIEEVYREQGWKVTYDKPGYNESYGAFWEFKG